MKKFKDAIRSVPDFPKPGIDFKDITTLLKDPKLLSGVIEQMLIPFSSVNIHKIAGIEARGFIFAPAMATACGAGFIPIRKPGKLPAETVSVEYQLEYGTDKVEIHRDAVTKGENVLLVDDLLATGGTALAAIQLLEKLGANIIGISFLVELDFLKGREKFADYNIHSLVHY